MIEYKVWALYMNWCRISTTDGAAMAAGVEQDLGDDRATESEVLCADGHGGRAHDRTYTYEEERRDDEKERREGEGRGERTTSICTSATGARG